MLGTILRASGRLLAGSVAVLWLFGERWRPIRASTLAFLRAGGRRGLLDLSSLHGYIYMRWSKQYIGFLFNRLPPPRPDSPIGKWLSDRYHGKVLTPELARAVITLDQPVPLCDLEQIIPYPTARNLVLAGPPEIAAYECHCRANRDNPCQPTQVEIVIGQPFVDFVLEHQPRSARRLSHAEALDLLAAEHERGHVHAAWFKDAMLGRFYAICNCCKCCCGGIHAMTGGGVPMVASSGFVSAVDVELCTACGTCVDACPFGALAVDGAVAVRDWDKCLGCGVCVDQCPSEAIALVHDEGKCIPLDVRLLVHTQGEALAMAHAPENPRA